ncbi:MAG: bifunctional diaminohydroxyphosphoribosylaminopyrimidine deaminase/5-amino-6-(5-phosphoribosylamino)uracil reductase RibD [Candidatus Aminicenantes bacterium]|nr:bifunctional diaminohydroxyphosphoribosylaminopyrimidine deaminase/5-amino-6-(5-phosphoribosylamino)uracil reductase RibD [Candidatus Aminicenantes bacterium]
MMDAGDLAYIEMAYGLAETARGWTSPNPCVGAVVVNNGRVVGTGFHERPGKPHAEIVALVRAGARSRGATLYLTLEPCVHWGRTPPCIDTVLQAGLRRVVVSALDPNPLVDGRGVRRLRRAGIEVSVGLLEERNRRLNEAYIKYIPDKTPFVTLKAAAGLDGKIACRGGDSRWISSPASRAYAHLLRGEADAVLVGIGTVLRDDPRLTVRHPAWKAKAVARVVLDARLRFPPGARMLRTPARGPVWILTAPDPPAAKRKALELAGAEIVPLPCRGDRVDLPRALAALGRREVSHCLVEGGGRVHGAFLDARLADKIVLFFAPKVIGGAEAISLHAGAGADSVRTALRLRSLRSFPVGPDIVMEGYF